jgi:NhaD family Na+/H+ antiporter
MNHYAPLASGLFARYLTAVTALIAVLVPAVVLASAAGQAELPDLTTHTIGYLALALFATAYILVTAEEFTNLRKSKPVMIAAGLIWGLIGWVSSQAGLGHVAEAAARHNLLEYAELMLFLLVAMTYVNAMDERQVFSALRSWLVRRGFSFRRLFWLTGALAFVISPIADNLTTALLMCAVVMAVGADNSRFVSIACVNIVVAANAGGAFSPFGDITTLMVWQKGMVEFWTFFLLLVPSLVNFVVPAAIMHFAVPNGQPMISDEVVHMKPGARVIMALFILTIATSVSFHNILELPPVLGMLTGLGYLQLFGFILKRVELRLLSVNSSETNHAGKLGDVVPFDVFNRVARAEWDTLLFFYGVVMCVGGLGFIGYLGMASEIMYTQWGATTANVAVGLLSSVIDNIPVMFAVLSMNPDMSTGQWLLVTLTAGVGGSLLSVGSAAGVALMGQARGKYTFFGHLRWTPVIALGYGASILVHMWINAGYF